MRRHWLTGIAALIWWGCAVAIAAPLEGRVVSVADGDSLTLREPDGRQHRIRLLGIDAPERTQPFGPEARELLSGWVLGRDVTIQYDQRDRHRRILGVVWLEGEDINRRLVHEGAAWHYKQYQSGQTWVDRVRYALAQWRARQDGRGLWAHAEPVPPWAYRREAREAADRVRDGRAASPAVP